MTFQEALIILSEGGKVRRPDWRDSVYLYLDDQGVLRNSLGSEYKADEEHAADFTWMDANENP